jgi:type I restriction enzyme, S subunit
MEVAHEIQITKAPSLPENWFVKKLKDISAFITKGATPTTYGFKWEDSGVLFLRSECVSSEGLDLAQAMFISEHAHRVLNRSEIQTNDILVTITGNVGRVIYLTKGFGSGNINQHIARVRITDSKVDRLYVFHFLNQRSQRRKFESIVTGQAYPQISLEQVREANIYFPPSVAEQTAIAVALSDADALIISLEKLIVKKRNIKQGAMQQLLRPKEGWIVKKLGEVCRVFGRIGFRGYTIKDIVEKGGGAISISPSNIKNDTLNLEKCTYISWFKYEESPEIKIYNGDILLVKTGSTFGKTALVKNLREKATLNPQLVVLKNMAIDNIYLSYMMSSPTVQNQIAATIVGGAIPTLSQESVSNFEIPMPESREEQHQIGQILNCVDEELTLIEAKLEKYKHVKQGMMQQLLTGKMRVM